MTAVKTEHIEIALRKLNNQLEGEVHFDQLSKSIYATDASIYKEEPIGVAYPKSIKDIKTLVKFALSNKTSLIPRSGGTSLSGQCVGNGLVVDVSRYMNQVVNFDLSKNSVSVQPGIVRDELNAFLKPHKLFFAPITSTANRATLGGMVGNNSCGTNSIVYGDTRRYVSEVKGVLSDGNEVVFRSLNEAEFYKKCVLTGLEGDLYRNIRKLLDAEEDRINIKSGFPKTEVHRRNTGYALDELLLCLPFETHGKAFNFSKLLAGSEGTLMFMTEMTMSLSPIPPKHELVIIAQFETINLAMRGVTQVMRHKPYACELMDKVILDCTKDNLKYSKIREHFVGDPAGSLMVEFRGNSMAEVGKLGDQLIVDLKTKGIGYHYSIIKGADCKDVWELRSAGLGLLANIPGDEKAVACIEDTAVAIEDLADYMTDFALMMKEHGQDVVYYAHAGAGEIHLRPILNLKLSSGQKALFDISNDSANLVKKYNGSLSGEHGDGRVRAPFIPIVLGEANYNRFVSIKDTWDPHNIFNPGKIVKAKPITDDLRYLPDQVQNNIKTVFDFSELGGVLRLAEKCNGSGDCRKLPLSGGTMCPSYQATRQEKHTTRARANALRTFLSDPIKENPFDHPELKEVLDLCLSCKGCTSECPSNVDMTTLKSEFQYQYNKSNGVPFRSKVFAHINEINALGAKFSSLSNFFLKQKLSGTLIKNILGVAAKRSFPKISDQSLRVWFTKRYKANNDPKHKKVYLFCDEFTNYNDTEIGKKSILLLDALGYDVQMIAHDESGRAALSKGILEKAKRHANNNVRRFHPIINSSCPLIGVEPSALLSFRDEYPKLVDGELRNEASELAKNTYLIEEFLAMEIRNFIITSQAFDQENRSLIVHGHCHQKALSSMHDVFTVLSLPKGNSVKILDTGCCGMAGSFGYEKEHYEISQKIGELTLFPLLRNRKENDIVVASGTSCRHQMLDGSSVKALHPVEVLYSSLKSRKN